MVRRLAAVLVILTLTAGVITALARWQTESKAGTESKVGTESKASTGSASDADSASDAGSRSDRTQVVPRPGQTIVTGLIDSFAAEDAQGGPLAPPLTVTAVERGQANLTIENAVVGGAKVAINWAGGTPLPISGAGGLDLGAAHVEADGSGVTWTLDGAPRVVLPGAYRATAPVGVGPSGIATPRESVDFQADERTVLVSRGGTVVHLPPRRVTVEGPGKVVVTGRLRARAPDGDKAVGRVELLGGPFRVTLEPSGTQMRIDAVLQGPVTTS